ncbi:hypothetical protein AB6A40_000840 [Gnathostoma spinigerum]|uniref:Uncharacterized protein n=1 Tax=Gnathostoma spinigerum TaxID=75299 RepID=A0ABD6E505_9BILA
MFIASLFVCLCLLSSGLGFVEIDELRKMVTNPSDNAELWMLENDRVSPRSSIIQRVNAIVARQPANIQNIYRNLVAREKAEDQAKYQSKLMQLRYRNASPQQIQALQQAYQIKTNMALSRQQASNQKNLIYRNAYAWGSTDSRDNSFEWDD